VSYEKFPMTSQTCFLSTDLRAQAKPSCTRRCSNISAVKKIVLVVAMSGIAALLLDGGRTVHSRFKLQVPLPLDGATANVKASSGLAELFRHTGLLIWDEAPNAPKSAFDAVDRCLRDILGGLPKRSRHLPFGGLPVLLGGDFRQIPPVLRHVDADAVFLFTLRSCSFWSNARTTKNIH
jgi:hypothetical protein